MESEALSYLREAELNLKREEKAGITQERAIALTHVQTAILWLCKDELEVNLAAARQAVQDLLGEDKDCAL